MQLAGIILENWYRGRKRHIWISASSDLQFDARRDLEDIGATFIDSKFIGDFAYNTKIDRTFQEGL